MPDSKQAAPLPRQILGDDGPACVVCGCTQNNACEEGCCWAVGNPPVCSSCVTIYLIAEQWRLLEERRGRDARVDEMERMHRELARAGYVPKFGDLRVIQRRIEKIEQAKS